MDPVGSLKLNVNSRSLGLKNNIKRQKQIKSNRYKENIINLEHDIPTRE